jgi:MFS family permease
MSTTATKPEATHERSRRRIPYKWSVLTNTTLGMLMATVNASILIISLPAIFDGLHLDPLAPGNVSYLLWMLMGYMLVTAVLVVTLGRLGDMYGRVRIYNAGFAVSTAASVALALTPTGGAAGAIWLIAFRVVQGVGGAMMVFVLATVLALAGAVVSLFRGGVYIHDEVTSEDVDYEAA